MRLTQLSIDGYGKFRDEDLDIAPGLQIIAGPNERGKSTLRHFISDMLYGQKRNSNRRIYEESHELRAPWDAPNGYGGRVTYILDAGQEFEIQRSFEAANEFVRVFDRTNAQDATGDFPTLKNRESTFAEVHLKMTKSVFLGTATISHVSLSELGDKQALISIREKLLSLTDSGSEDQSAEKSIKWLQDRITSIGQPAARTKPLPITRQHLTDLQAEYQEVHEAAKEVVVFQKQRAGVLEALGGLLYRRSAVERELKQREIIERADLLSKAEETETRIDAITKQCFVLGEVRDFPLDKLADVQRLVALHETAERQAARAAQDLEALNQQMGQAIDRLEDQGVSVMKEADGDIEMRLTEIETEVGRLKDHLGSIEETRDRFDNDLVEAEEHKSEMPDFGAIGSDPVQTISQLTGQFETARLGLTEEQTRLEELRETAEQKDTDLERLRGWFSGHEGILPAIRRYEEGNQEKIELNSRLQHETTSLTHQVEDLGSKVPGFLISSAVSFALAVVLGLIGWLTGNTGFFMPAAIVGAMFIFFGGAAVMTRRELARARGRLSEIESEELSQMYHAEDEDKLIEELMKEAECQAPRELEALYDEYQKGQADIAAHAEQVEAQEARLAHAEERLDGAREAVAEAFGQVDESFDDDDEVQTVSNRIVSRYQEYRDSKRRASEYRDGVNRNESEAKELTAKIEALKEEELELSLQVRAFLRENHYPEEKDVDSALMALRGYRIRSAQMRQKQGELEVFQGQIKMAKRQLEAEEFQLNDNRRDLGNLLEQVQAESVEDYYDRAKKAQQYQELWKERSVLQDQLDTLLADQDINELRASVPESDRQLKSDGATTESLRAELQEILEELDAKRKQEHALHIMITERAAGLRSLNEVDEERAATEQRMAELELELKAASYAISVIEEVTREQHSRIAPKLAKLASEYLKEITDGVYDELLIDRDMQISIRIPQTKSMDADPSRRLSQGTVDQIYFALRLAMVQTMSEDGERVPMVLDDPFSNYDDKRLGWAMRLLARIGETNQVLLFTCREDVVRAAEAVKAPVLRI